MKKHLIVTCCVLLLVSFLISCGANEKKNFITDTDAGYEIEESDGKFYLVITDDAYKSTINESQTEPYLSFSSVSEMKDKILSGKLTENEIAKMSTFSKNSDKKIEVMDFKKVYEPIFPSDIIWDGSVKWYGKYYHPSFVKSDKFMYMTFSVQTSDIYQDSLQRSKDSIHNNDLVTITDTVQTEERNATVYHYTTSSGEFKSIEYVIETENGKIFVMEDYRLTTNNKDLPTSDTIPSSIDLYGDFGDRYFDCFITGLTERPSLAWLSCFGLDEIK